VVLRRSLGVLAHKKVLAYLLVGRPEVSSNPMVGITDIGPLSAASFSRDRSGMI